MARINFIFFGILLAAIFFCGAVRLSQNKMDLQQTQNEIRAKTDVARKPKNRYEDRLKNIFERHARTNYWKNNESVSGYGSTIRVTEKIRKDLESVFKKYHIKTILDAPCGDFNWMAKTNLSSVQYIGVDIVPYLINKNNAKFKKPGVDFKVLDIIKDKILKVDLIFCRDCIQHLSLKNISKALQNFKNSKSKYLLITQHVKALENIDIPDGGYREINLLIDPFNLPSCAILEKFIDKVEEYGDRNFMYMFDLNKI